MKSKTPYPMLANRILRKAKRAEIAMQKQRTPAALRDFAEKTQASARYGHDVIFNAPMNFSMVFAAASEDKTPLINFGFDTGILNKEKCSYAPDEVEPLGLPTRDLKAHWFICGEAGSGMTNNVGTTVERTT